MDVYEALDRVDQGLGGVPEANVIRAFLGDLRTMAIGARNAMVMRDMIHAQEWVDRLQGQIDYARIQEKRTGAEGQGRRGVNDVRD